MTKSIPLRHLFFILLSLCGLHLPAAAQGDRRQAMCQVSWETCLGTAEGKDWKPVYNRCLKARSACLGGRAFTPEIAPVLSPTSTTITTIQQGFGSGSDQANADPATRDALCENGRPRGESSSCTLVRANDGYGQNFSLVGPGVPLARIQRISSVVKCAGGKVATFYPNGRIESCTLDNSGAPKTSLTGTTGKEMSCGASAVARFDPEGRLISCGPL